AHLLAGAERPVVMAGSGGDWGDAAAHLPALAESTRAPRFMNGAGRGRPPRRPPPAFSPARGVALGPGAGGLVLGTPLDFRLGYGRPPSFADKARVAMVDCDPVELGRNRPLELGLTSHIGLTLRAVVAALDRGLPARFERWREAVGKKEAESQ